MGSSNISVRSFHAVFIYCANESVFAMAGYSVFRHAGTEADLYFMLKIAFAA